MTVCNGHLARFLNVFCIGLMIGVLGLVGSNALAQQSVDALRDWTSWRGPDQNGTSRAVGLPDTLSVDGSTHLWSYEIAGRGTPVIHQGRVYAIGYEGEGADLEEVLLCLDERTGERIWEQRANDFLSDVIYSRYAIGSPTVDTETGNVYWFTTGGDFLCFDREGTMQWMQPLIEDFGRQTYPNGRTGAPLIDDDLVIVRTMTVMWGPLGPARDRFLAFDKKTGESVWVSTPGGPPKDAPYSHPVVEWRDGRRVLYAGTAGGNVVCVDVRTGVPIWRLPLSVGGVCASPVLYRNTLLVTHARENLDNTEIGRTIAIDLKGAIEKGRAQQAVLGKEHEKWRNSVSSFTSSPVLVGDRMYITDSHGELCCIDATDGTLMWHEKLDTSQIHASPIAADGKLYVPMVNGDFFAIRPTDSGPQILSKVELEGDCLGAPAIANGRIYVHTTQRLYCFGSTEGQVAPGEPMAELSPMRGAASQLQMVPDEITVAPGDVLAVRARVLDEHGNLLDTLRNGYTLSASPGLSVDGSQSGRLVIPDNATPGTGVITATLNGMTDTMRVRIVPGPSFEQDFESATLNRTMPDGTGFAMPPGEWLGGPPRWQILEKDGSKVAARTIDNPIFQRTMTPIGDSRTANSTVTVDIMSDGNRRSMSTGGVVNQRYLILLKGNHQELELTSNVERIKENVPFRWKPGVWYRLKTRVQNETDGSTTVQAKVWPRDGAEPDGWMLEYRHANGHRFGAPGVYGFTPQSRYRVYLDNLSIQPNNN